MKLQSKRKKFYKEFFRVTITKKILIFYFFLLLSTVGLTSLFSFFLFQKFIENEMLDLNVNIDKLKIKLEELFESDQGNITFDINDIEDYKKNLENNSQTELLDNVVKDFPDYYFKVETIEGTVEFEERPKLAYKDGKYFFEASREIRFEESDTITSLKVSLKVEFYKIILKSLFVAALITIIILFPFILLFSRTIIKPIIKISKGAKQIAEGNLGVKVKSYTKDEIGDLVKTFNYMSKELHKIKRIRDDLLAVISHELRSPLGRIKGYTEILIDLKLNKKEKGDYFDSIFSEIDFLNHMIGEIIEISRLELNKEQLFLEVIDLADLIDDVKKDLELSNPVSKNIHYDFKYNRNLFCNIDVTKIKRVLLNIFENSSKAKSTMINFIAKKEDDNIIIRIIDNGIGITEDQLEIVFEKFYRVDKSRDRKTGGFGLGLAICRGIINEHDGKIYFVKREDGAEIRIEIPSHQQIVPMN